jgi:hypothetical protein
MPSQASRHGARRGTWVGSTGYRNFRSDRASVTAAREQTENLHFRFDTRPVEQHRHGRSPGISSEALQVKFGFERQNMDLAILVEAAQAMEERPAMFGQERQDDPLMPLEQVHVGAPQVERCDDVQHQ